MAYPKKIKITCEELRKMYYDKNLSMYDIARILGVHRASVLARLRKCGIKSKGHGYKLVRYHPNFKKENDIAYILGVMLTDGYIGNSWRNKKIVLATDRIEFAESFSNALARIGLRPRWRIIKPKKQNHKWLIRVEANSSEFAKWYHSLSKEEIVNIVDKKPIDFLRGVYEGDGSLVIRGKNQIRVYPITNTNIWLINIVTSLLTKLNFNYSIWKRKKRNYKTIYMVNLLGKTNKKLEFIYLINPSIKKPKPSPSPHPNTQ